MTESPNQILFIAQISSSSLNLWASSWSLTSEEVIMYHHDISLNRWSIQYTAACFQELNLLHLPSVLLGITGSMMFSCLCRACSDLSQSIKCPRWIELTAQYCYLSCLSFRKCALWIDIFLILNLFPTTFYDLHAILLFNSCQEKAYFPNCGTIPLTEHVFSLSTVCFIHYNVVALLM